MRHLRLTTGTAAPVRTGAASRHHTTEELVPNPLRVARALTLVTLTLVGFACYTAWRHQWVALGSLAYGAAIVALAARLEYRAQHRIRAEAVRAERMDRPYHPEPPPLVPCCRLWVQSNGEVHDGQRCTRPVAARTRLSVAEQDAFSRITSSFDESRDSA